MATQQVMLGEYNQYTPGTAFLLHCDGTNGGTTFTDSGPYGLIFTSTGGITTSTAQSVFGGASALSGSNSDYISTPFDTRIVSSNYIPWTWECRFRPTSLANPGILFNTASSGTISTGWEIFVDTNGTLTMYSGPDALHFGGSGTAVTVNTWYALAVSWDGIRLYFFVNGILQNIGGTTGFTNIWANSPLRIMNSFISANNEQAVGYMDELRFSKGCLYNSNYSVATSPF